jgi:hypothetical protein
MIRIAQLGYVFVIKFLQISLYRDPVFDDPKMELMDCKKSLVYE